MICVIALFVFGILGIFSAKYRIIAKEAFDCVFRRITLRKCQTGLDKRLKGQITGNLMRHSPGLAKFTYKNFEIISWIFTILLVLSLVQSGISVYNFAAYGNCNGPTNTGFCIFDPLKTEEISACSAGTSTASKKDLSEPTDISGFPTFGKKDSKVKFIMFGCYTCPFTKQSANAVFNVYEKYKDKVEFVFIDFPIPNHENSFLAAEAAQCVYEQNSNVFIEYSKKLYADKTLTADSLKKHASEIGIDVNAFNECVQTHKYEEFINKSLETGHKSGIYGTPTFFISNKHIVGPTTERSFEKLINDELKK